MLPTIRSAVYAGNHNSCWCLRSSDLNFKHFFLSCKLVHCRQNHICAAYNSGSPVERPNMYQCCKFIFFLSSSPFLLNLLVAHLISDSGRLRLCAWLSPCSDWNSRFPLSCRAQINDVKCCLCIRRLVSADVSEEDLILITQREFGVGRLRPDADVTRPEPLVLI